MAGGGAAGGAAKPGHKGSIIADLDLIKFKKLHQAKVAKLAKKQIFPKESFVSLLKMLCNSIQS